MHTFHHEPTGVRIHYNSDYSGDAIVVLPDGVEFRVPAKALSSFGLNVFLTARWAPSKLPGA